MGGVEVEKDFDVGSGSFQAFVGFSAGGGCAGGFDRYGAGSQFLGDEHRESLRTLLVPVVDVREQFELVVEVVVEDGNDRGAEGVVLIVGSRALHLQSG